MAISDHTDTTSGEPARPGEARRLGGIWGWLRGFMVAFLATSIIMLLGLVLQFFVIQSLRESPRASVDDVFAALALSDVIVGLGGLGYFVLFILCIIFWLRLMFRAMKNLHVSGARGPLMSAGWAVGWYFIPIAWLWKPLQGVRQIWSASHDPAGTEDPRVPSAIGWWWACWIIGNIISQISLRIGIAGGQFEFDQAPDLDTLQITVVLDAVNSLIDVPLVLLAIWFWARIVKAQDDRFAASSP